jgi:DNA-binding LacI/PurR family transcriptional regulator
LKPIQEFFLPPNFSDNILCYPHHQRFSVHLAQGIMISKRVAKVKRSHNSASSTTASVDKGTLVLLSSNLVYWSRSEVACGANLTARNLGYRFLCFDCYDSAELERECILTILRRNVAGVLLVCSDDTKNLSLCQRIVRKVPTVQVIAAHPMIVADKVAVDEYAGATLAMEHLVRLGYRRIGHVTFDVDTSPVSDRERAYRDYMAKIHLSVSDQWVLRLPDSLYHTDPAHRKPWLKKFLQSRARPSAVFAQADRLAVELVQVAAESGLSVPQDLAVVGFDDIPAHALTSIPLTTVRQNFRHLGRLAVERLVWRLQGNVSGPTVSIRSNPQLIVRESSVGLLTRDDRWIRVQKYMAERFRETLPAKELASIAALEPHYFSKQFSKAFGKKFTDYRNHLRLEYGRELLLTKEWSIETIAQDCGFQSPNQFYRLFRQNYGTTPRQYRDDYALSSKDQ